MIYVLILVQSQVTRCMPRLPEHCKSMTVIPVIVICLVDINNCSFKHVRYSNVEIFFDSGDDEDEDIIDSLVTLPEPMQPVRSQSTSPISG